MKILCFSLSREEAESLTSQTEISKGERGDRRTLSLIHLSTTPQCNLSRKMTPCLYRWSFLLLFTALVPIELFSQILLRAYRVARKIRRSKDLNSTAKMYTTLGFQKRLIDRLQDELLIFG